MEHHPYWYLLLSTNGESGAKKRCTGRRSATCLWRGVLAHSDTQFSYSKSREVGLFRRHFRPHHGHLGLPFDMIPTSAPTLPLQFSSIYSVWVDGRSWSGILTIEYHFGSHEDQQLMWGLIFLFLNLSFYILIATFETWCVDQQDHCTNAILLLRIPQ